jgi:hypothetical protein
MFNSPNHFQNICRYRLHMRFTLYQCDLPLILNFCGHEKFEIFCAESSFNWSYMYSRASWWVQFRGFDEREKKSNPFHLERWWDWFTNLKIFFDTMILFLHDLLLILFIKWTFLLWQRSIFVQSAPSKKSTWCLVRKISSSSAWDGNKIWLTLEQIFATQKCHRFVTHQLFISSKFFKKSQKLLLLQVCVQ